VPLRSSRSLPGARPTERSRSASHSSSRTQTSDNLCKFPVRIEITANKEYVKFFSDGRLLVNGKLFVRITNLNTGKSMDVNISGPANVTLTSERNMGRGLLLLFPEDAGGPGLFLNTGRLDVIRGEDGFITNYTVRGTSVDVCAALAA